MKLLLGGLSLLALAGILVAGLWPFHSPRNDISWAPGQNGIRIGAYGTALSSRAFDPASTAGSPGSLEIWLAPAAGEESGSLIAFYTPENPLRFRLRQSGTDLEVNRQNQAHQMEHLYLDGVFHPQTLVFLTLTAGPGGLTIYVDGRRAKTFPGFGSGLGFEGRTIVATSPVSSDNWSGLLQGLALYSSELTASQVSQHYQSWTRQGAPEVTIVGPAAAVYLFEEGSGSVIHARPRQAPDLLIPARYMIVQPNRFQPFWTEYFAGWSYWKNVLINVLGFIPLGFFFSSYFVFLPSLRRPLLSAVLLGAAVSFLIEGFQGFLPTRQSGTTDLITNTLGTALGALLAGNQIVRALWAGADRLLWTAAAEKRFAASESASRT